MKQSLSVPALCISLLLPLSAGAAIHRVRMGATGTNNGGSWENARTDLHAALLAAAPGDSVWVAAGTWHADWNAATGARTGDRERRFTLKTGVTVLGGFAGTETGAGQRDWWKNRTILSGELGGPGRDDNTRTIMATPFGVSVTGCVVDGLTFIGGRADNPLEGGGGDLIGGNGGALFLRGETVVQNCIFLGNSATYGGAIKVMSGPAHLWLRQCLFVGNTATWVGGALDFHAYRQPLEITGCTFLMNGAFRAPAVGTNSAVATWKGNVAGAGQGVEKGTDGTMTEWNVWAYPDDKPPPGEGNIYDYNPQYLDEPFAGSDTGWGTEDDLLLLGLRALSAAVNRVPVTALPPDITDADGDGDITEPIPFDLSHRQRVRDGAADSGAFEMVNEAPTKVTFVPVNTLEGEPVETWFGGLRVEDSNGPGHTLSLVAGAGDTDNALLQLSIDNLHTTAVLDFESKPALSIRVRAVDPLGLAVEQQLTLAVKDRIERTLRFEIVKAFAWEPAGGVTGRSGPDDWPEHWAAVRLLRTGEPGPLDVTLQIDDRTYVVGEDAWPSDDHGGKEFRIHIPGAEVYPASWEPPVIHFDAAQNEVLLGIEPLFDDAPDEGPGELEIKLTDGGADYQRGTPASAVITIYDSPSRAWATLPDRAPLTPEQLAAFALGATPDGRGPGLRAALLQEPQQIEITGTLNPAARDVSLSWELSADLQSWTAVQPAALSISGTEAHWRFPVAGPRAYYRPRGTASAQATGFGAGIASSFAYIPAGAAGFAPSIDEPEVPGIRYQQRRPFWIARTELRRGDPSSIDVFLPALSDEHPVTGITPDELSLFLQKATSQHLYGPIPPGYELRLPTEAEWLYAASLPVGAPLPATPLASRAWYLDNAFGIVHRTGLKQPDARGLYDTLGNVSEWTRGRLRLPAGSSLADDTSIVSDEGWPAVCGGNILLGEGAQTTMHRFSYPVTEPSPVIGFRLVIAPVVEQK
ncbi:MAG TPA: SUMF1/EgtB/PvdO family nonheme iron enzyme [Verrucomicrobiales bacterium]|nr:SUMF1/EgtB/PvdO family nonheme iron enzyme [Verrucomicrobiales bacterium]